MHGFSDTVTTYSITNPSGSTQNNASPSTSNGLIGNGWELTSTSTLPNGGDYISLTTSPVQSGTTLFTQNFWFNSGVSAPQSIFQQGASGNDLYGMLCSGTGQNCEVYVGNNGMSYYQFNQAVFAQNTWKMITIVYDGSGSGNSDKLKVYIDGTQHTSGAYGGGNNVPSSTGGNADPLHIGSRGTNGYGGDPTIDGTFDEWAWWSTALSDSEITSLYNGGSGVLSDTVSPSTLTTYYDFEETANSLDTSHTATETITTLADKSTNSISISTSDTETQKDMTQWTLSGFSSSGNSVQKTSGTGWNSNEYAKSVEEVTVGDKMIVLEFDGGNTGGAMFGFNYGSPTGHTSGNPNDFGFYLASVYGEVYENGSQASTSSGTPSLTCLLYTSPSPRD